MSAKEMKNYFKDQGLENPHGYWKMNKEQMMEEIVKHEKQQMKKEKTGHGNSKMVEVTMKDTYEIITFTGVGKFHAWVKENYPDQKSWSTLSAVLAKEDSEKVAKFEETSPFTCEFATGFQYGR